LTNAAQIIAREIKEKGPISLARFMELALYCPVYGYYEKEEDTIGRRGDYYTSVSVGGLFGELLGFQFAQWLGEAPGGDAVQLVEAGAHGGELARDILSWLHGERREIFERLEYWIIEPSARRRERQQRALVGFGERVRWVANLAELAGEAGRSTDSNQTRGIYRIVFANELLDALPAHRLRWDARECAWFEWGVTLDGDEFAWTRLASPEAVGPEEAWLVSPDPRLAAVVPDGFAVDICPTATDWWHAAAELLPRGKLLTFDYGLTAEEFLVPERQQGTLRGYRRHRLSPDVLAHAGEQDITAHVNFTAIQVAGESAGLQTEAFVTQSQFLTGVAERIWTGGRSFGEWTATRTRQFQTLTHPDHLGRSFRVLVQARG
jgi:SAM-dependent MidA family methyltransferase